MHQTSYHSLIKQILYFHQLLKVEILMVLNVFVLDFWKELISFRIILVKFLKILDSIR